MSGITTRDSYALNATTDDVNNTLLKGIIGVLSNSLPEGTTFTTAEICFLQWLKNGETIGNPVEGVRLSDAAGNKAEFTLKQLRKRYALQDGAISSDHGTFVATLFELYSKGRSEGKTYAELSTLLTEALTGHSIRVEYKDYINADKVVKSMLLLQLI